MSKESIIGRSCGVEYNSVSGDFEYEYKSHCGLNQSLLTTPTEGKTPRKLLDEAFARTGIHSGLPCLLHFASQDIIKLRNRAEIPFQEDRGKYEEEEEEEEEEEDVARRDRESFKTQILRIHNEVRSKENMPRTSNLVRLLSSSFIIHSHNLFSKIYF